MSFSSSRNMLSVALPAALALSLSAPAGASVGASVTGTTLRAASDGADRIEVACAGGDVKVNGADPAGGPAACASLTRVRVIGGPGANAIDLGGLTTAAEDIVVVGGRGDDAVAGSPRADRIVWNDGDGSDSIDGGAGDDTTVVNGAAAAGDRFTVAPNGRRVSFRRTNLGRFGLDLAAIETLEMNGRSGDDRISGTSGLVRLIALRMNGGPGDDTLIGSDGDDVMDAGTGDDTMVCGAGHDEMRGNRGDDRMVWNDGDGSDVMVGQAGRDTAEVNGSAADEHFTVARDHERVRFRRVNLARFRLDIATTERLMVDAGAGDDRIDTRAGLDGLIAGRFEGGDGDDTISGTDAADRLTGGRGSDRIRARDGAADAVRCGRGADVALIDRRDRVRGCDRVLTTTTTGRSA
jgi:Ca2+-binding RTX toxin-like protein